MKLLATPLTLGNSHYQHMLSPLAQFFMNHNKTKLIMSEFVMHLQAWVD